MLSLLTLAVACHVPATPQDAKAMQGTWHAVELRTEKAKVDLSPLELGITFEAEDYAFTHQLGTAKGRVAHGKPGLMTLISHKSMLYCSYTVTGETLTVAMWPTAETRRPAPTTEGGGKVWVFKKVRRKT